jgi:putative membrane protein insertion efficiency factor
MGAGVMSREVVGSTPPQSSAAPPVRWARRAVSAPIEAYGRWISPGLPRRCKYEPTCSAYALEAIREFGILRGLVLAAWRLLRCNPWSHGGWDPVEQQTLFAARGRTGSAPR